MLPPPPAMIGEAAAAPMSLPIMTCNLIFTIKLAATMTNKEASTIKLGANLIMDGTILIMNAAFLFKERTNLIRDGAILI